MEEIWALVNENDVVENVIVASEAFVLAHPPKESGWYYAPSLKNRPGIGSRYDKQSGAFIYPQPFPSWSLSEDFNWHPPVPYPEDGELYRWDEQSLSWKKFE